MRRWIKLIAVICITSMGCSEDPAPSAPDTATTQSVDAGSKDAGLTNNWAQGYTVDLEFHGGPADGRKIRLQRDLYGIQTVFSFGSTHYTQGEVGFAMTDTLQVDVEGIESQVEFILNFGLVIGSSKNPVHTDKAGNYPFSCKPPMVRVFYENFWFR
ncbi:MAG TPA: hypothetical protein DCQ06_11595, partial [Myxococcales bacterium]|nr:hypothetical protein [Myxococcales bacterium]HAN32232.1 hypothetical protein [Myxococcales bacterium]